MWLEKLKKIRELCTTKAGLVNINANDLDRMIAIVEGVEWTNDMKLTVYPTEQCPICYAQKEDGHLPTCPYSDEYKGG